MGGPAVGGLRADWKKLLRQVLRQVHPDHFASHPFELHRNSESLKASWQPSCDILAATARPGAA